MNKLVKISKSWLYIIALLFTFYACSLVKDPLEGTRWQLVGWTLSSLYPGDFAITAEFDNGQISGNSGVNSYSGSYELGAGNSFTVGQLMSTLMAGPEEAMRAESAYLELLGEANSFQIVDETLILYDKNGNELLIFNVIKK